MEVTLPAHGGLRGLGLCVCRCGGVGLWGCTCWSVCMCTCMHVCMGAYVRVGHICVGVCGCWHMCARRCVCARVMRGHECVLICQRLGQSQGDASL